MSSLDATPALARPPRLRVPPRDVASWEGIADDAAYLSAGYLVDLQDWQRDILSCWLAQDAYGRYAASTCGLLVPRQNGKTEAVAARILWGMLFGNGGAGEIISYSAHRVDASLIMFERLLECFGDSRRPAEEWKHPELHALVEDEIFTNGKQSIILKNGSAITFSARSIGGKRSSTVDVLIYDEAGFLTDDQQSASKSTASSAPHGNAQTIYLGTPPSEHGIYAEPFARVKAEALAGNSGSCWHEWSVAEFDRSMMQDQSVWERVNPALGTHLSLRYVRGETFELSPEKFAIERLCWWPETVSSKAINAAKWAACSLDKDHTPLPGEVERTAVGVKFAPDGLQVCASVALRLPDGRIHVELAQDGDVLAGVQWLAEWCAKGKDSIAEVWVDGRSGAENFAFMLVRSGFPKRAVHVMRASEAVTAATTLVSMVADGSCTHLADQTLDASATGAVKRKVGNDGYGFGGDCCAIESAAAAVLAARTTKRNPGRGEMIG